MNQVSLVIGGAFISQLINLLALLVLTRLYTPDDFGIFGIYSAIVSLGAVISGLRYELAVSLPKRDATATNIMALTALSVFTFAITILIIFIVFDLLDFLTNFKLFGYMFVIPFGIVAAGFYQTIIYWAMRQNEFQSISTSRIGQSTSIFVIQLAFGFLGAGMMGLIVGNILSHVAGAMLLILKLGGVKSISLRQVTWSRMQSLAIHFQRFPKFSVLEGLAAAAATQLPFLVFAANFSPTRTGQFMLTLQIAQAPLRLIGSAMGQVVFSRVAEAKREGHLTELMTSTMRMLARLGVAPLLMTTTIAPELFVLIFGETWRSAGTYVFYLTPILVLEFIFAPLSVAVAAIETRFSTLLSRLMLIGVPLSVLHFIALATGDPIISIASYSVTGSITYLAFGSWLMNVTKVPQWIWIKIFTVEILLAFIPFLLLLGLKMLIDPMLFGLEIIGFGVLGICTWYYLLTRKNVSI